MKALVLLLTLITLVSCSQSEESSGLVSGVTLPTEIPPEVEIPQSLAVTNSIIINASELNTTSDAATLTLAATSANEMYISLSSCDDGGTWEAYATSKAITLNTNTSNTVYFKVNDSLSLETECITASINHDDQAPDAPTSITLANNGSDIASDYSSWSVSADNGPSGVENYEMAVSTSSDPADIIVGGEWSSTLNQTTFQINSGITLTGGVDYYTLVRAIDATGNTGSEAVSSAWQIIVSPEIVNNLEVTNATTTALSIGWAYPQDNGTAITDYDIMIKGGVHSDWTLLTDGTSTATSSTLSALDADTAYEFKIRAFNGINYSGWSNVLTTSTLPNVEFFQPGYKAINISGAPKSKLVSMEDSNEIYLNGVLVTTINKHQTYEFNSADFDQIEGTGPFYVAGKLGTGSGSQDQGNATWATQAWVGKDFIFNLTRSAPMKLKVYAFTDSTVSVTKAGVAVDSQTITAGNGHTFTINDLASYEMSSTGYIVAFSYANSGGGFYDPTPLLPASKDIIGFPSSKGMTTTGTNLNNFVAEHSNGSTQTGVLNTGTTLAINPQGTSSLYASQSLRIRADEPIMAVSNADSDGYCQAPFVPVSMLKKNFAINAQSEWVALASDRPVTVTITKPDLTTTTVTLTRTGAGAKTPYKAYINTVYPEGTTFEGDDVFQAWYQPYTTTYSGGDDETVMFGWD